MNRYKFRGKRLDNGEWAYGYLIGKDVIVGDIVEFNDEYFNTEFWIKVDHETVGQWTGLKDKNGVEIYEDDKVKQKYKSINYGTEHAFYLEVFRDKTGAWRIKYPNKSLGCVYSLRKGLEVIGNIHDASNEQ